MLGISFDNLQHPASTQTKQNTACICVCMCVCVCVCVIDCYFNINFKPFLTLSPLLTPNSVIMVCALRIKAHEEVLFRWLEFWYGLKPTQTIPLPPTQRDLDSEMFSCF